MADFDIEKGPPVVKSENARKTAWVYVDIRDTDIGSYVQQAKEAVEEKAAELEKEVKEKTGE